ncbi:MAG: putative quinol monooxygenase [Akkermansiaceae bacterium]
MTPETTVSIHPYFKPHEGKLEEFVAGMAAFVERTSSEKDVLYYDFTVSAEGVVFCREAYVGAEGALAHLGNVDEQLKGALAISDLIRLEVHGAAAELDKMREPLAGLPVDWFVLETGLVK